MTNPTNKVELGAHEYTVVAQPHAVILRKFPNLMKDAQGLGGLDMEGGGEALIMVLGDRVYDALKIFIPNLMNRHEFHGYRTNSDMEAGEFNEEYALEHAPTLPQIFDAFDVAIAVNGGKRLKDLLGKTLGPELTRVIRSVVVAQLRVRLSQMSVNSLSDADGSDQSMSSTTSDPTPETQENEASQSLVSST